MPVHPLIPPNVEKTNGVNEPISTSLILCSDFLCFSFSNLRYNEATGVARYDEAVGLNTLTSKIYARTNQYSNSFFPRSIRLWNSLPPDLIQQQLLQILTTPEPNS